MSYISLNPENNHTMLNKQMPFNSLKGQSEKSKEIKQGMSPKEIAEVVSDHLICNVKQQFESVRSKLKQPSL